MTKGRKRSHGSGGQGRRACSRVMAAPFRGQGWLRPADPNRPQDSSCKWQGGLSRSQSVAEPGAHLDRDHFRLGKVHPDHLFDSLYAYT